MKDVSALQIRLPFRAFLKDDLAAQCALLTTLFYVCSHGVAHRTVYYYSVFIASVTNDIFHRLLKSYAK